MISRVRLVRFKRFDDQTFDLSESTILLAGPNNSGKTTLLHAMSAWNLALKRWLAERGSAGGKRRISIVLDEFTALPLREMNLLWLNRHTARRVAGQKQPKPAPIYVEVIDSSGELVSESLTIEFMYANEKLVYVRPVRSPEEPEPIELLPRFATNLNIVHVPPFSGIGTQEPRHASGIRHKLVGEGKPGEIVRNLLVDIWERSAEGEEPTWQQLAADIERLFQCELLQPQFSDAQPYLICEYRPRLLGGGPAGRGPKLDIANAGSGFHQVLLLLSFIYARPASVLLLDEPDAHLHFILQREIFDHLRTVAQRRSCKLVVATHAEVLLSDAAPEEIISFVGDRPRQLMNHAEKQRLQQSLQQLTPLDLLQADHVRAALYVEDESDGKLLREWARVLGHPAIGFLNFPYIVPLRGKGNLDQARQHFQCLRLAKPDLRGMILLDSDADPQPATPGMPEGMLLRRWPRYEIENYLLIPSVVRRFVQREIDLFTQHVVQADLELVERAFAENFPRDVEYLGNIQSLRQIKGSEFLVDLLARSSRPLPKRDLFMLANLMRPEEIHGDVRVTLDMLATILPAHLPAVDANATVPDAEGLDEANDE